MLIACYWVDLSNHNVSLYFSIHLNQFIYFSYFHWYNLIFVEFDFIVICFKSISNLIIKNIVYFNSFQLIVVICCFFQLISIVCIRFFNIFCLFFFVLFFHARWSIFEFKWMLQCLLGFFYQISILDVIVVLRTEIYLYFEY